MTQGDSRDTASTSDLDVFIKYMYLSVVAESPHRYVQRKVVLKGT